MIKLTAIAILLMMLGFAPSASASQPLSSAQLFTLTNQYRAARGLPHLYIDPVLCQMASARLPQIKTDWSHNGFWSYLRVHPWLWSSYSLVGENLAKNFTDSDAVVSAWDHSPTHKANLTQPAYNRVCFAVGGGFVVQEFGSTK